MFDLYCGSAAGAAHDHHVFVDVVFAKVVDVADLDLFPVDVVNGAGLLVDEVMVRLELRIENDAFGVEMKGAEDPFLDEQIEGVVNGGAGDRRETGGHLAPDTVGGGVIRGGEDVLSHGQAVGGGADAVLDQTSSKIVRHL